MNAHKRRFGLLALGREEPAEEADVVSLLALPASNVQTRRAPPGALLQ